MTTAKVLVSDKLSDNGVNILRDADGIEVDVKTGMSPEELLETIPAYDGLVIRSGTKVTDEVLGAAKNLKVIGRAGIGVDNVDVKAASTRGIVVMNTPEGNITTTAEHTIAMMMALCRKIPQATASVKAGKWEKKKFMGMELCGKTLGVVGIGRIGSIVVKRARGLEMRVIAFDPFISAEAAQNLGVELVELDDLYARADIISVHTPMTDQTRGMINESAFGKMKKNVRIINCARGGIVEESALAVAIKEGKVAGAALDVFESEPPKDNPLVGMDEVIFTPHLGASTTEAQENVAVAVAEQFVDFFESGLTRNAINLPSIDPELLKKVKPYLEMGERIGSFVAQVADGAPEKVRIEYMGELADIDHRAITQSILKGILQNYVGENVNMVNAPFLAESRGIVVSTGATSIKRNFSALIGVKLKTASEETYVEGTIFAGDEPRLVKLQDFLIEAKLDGDMLVITNEDKLGVIGRIGSFLGANAVNIAAFHLGRAGTGGKAMSIISVDSRPTADQLGELAGLDNILDVRLARL